MQRQNIWLITVVTVSLIALTIVTEVTIKLRSQHILNFGNNTAPLNSTQAVHIEAPKGRPPCSDSNWPRASAWWFLAGLAIACISLPRGSLNFHRSGRVWRLSPIFLLLEDLTILLYLVDGLQIFGYTISNFRICCLSILATREGNAWSQEEHDRFFDESADRHFKFGVGELYGAMFPGLVASDTQPQETESIEMQERQGAARGSSITSALEDSEDPPPSPVSRRTTANLEEGRRVQRDPVADAELPSDRLLNEGGSASMEDWFIIGEQTEENALLSTTTSAKITQLVAYRFFQNIQQIRNYEKGPTYRILLWLPILQNFSKAFLVRGSSFTVAVGFIYLASFFLVEGLRLAAAREPNTNACHQAMYLMGQWGDMKRIPRHLKAPRTTNRVGLRMEPKRSEFWELGWIFISAALNIILFSKVFGISAFSDPFFGYSEPEYNTSGSLDIPWLSKNGFSAFLRILLLFLMVVATLIVMITFWFLAVPLGALIPMFLSVCYAATGKDLHQRWPQMTIRDLFRFAPVFSAVSTATLAFVAYWGFGPLAGIFYDCSTTQKKAFYDYLG